jgi:hypothetical protein
MKFAIIRDDLVEFCLDLSIEEAPALFPDLLCVEVGDRPCEVGWRYQDGQFIDPTPKLTLEDAIAQKQREIQDFAQTLLEASVTGYSNIERDTWFGKESEANAFLANNDPAVAPHLVIESSAAGIPLAALAQVVSTKAAMLKTYSSLLLGVRAYHVRAVATSKTVEAAQSYDFSHGWMPGT